VLIQKRSVENRQSSSGVPSEQLVKLGSAREAEKMALRVQVWSVNQWATASPRKLKNLQCVKSVARKQLMEIVTD
jgi:hypothetical protein